MVAFGAEPFVNSFLSTLLREESDVLAPEPGETRNTKVTRGYAHGVPQRLRDAINSLGKGKLLISGTPALRQVAQGA